ncbi:hypothetical protein VPUCM_1454 [Vibrio parahaemolyticus UCM-V493]|nr:hypothetical protein VPUCM_1454 [Vibrio parahaemolyticus UCM-V493]
MKPRGTNNAAETNSQSKKSFWKTNLTMPTFKKVATPKNESAVETMPTLDFYHAS